MKLLELRLTSFRGVDERVLTFPKRGVVVIEGPNEIGKSSLGEALDLLLEELDSTKKRRVLDVRPVDRDVGPEVEALIESGPYRFRYKKRFLKSPETVLQVETPRPENLTGRTAHERVQRILGETMDMDLWRALRMKQGEAMNAAQLDGAPSLLRALDATAGGETAGDRELTLFERVHAEFAQFYTDTGREKAPLKNATEACDVAEDRRTSVRDELAALQRDIDRSAQLAQSAKELSAQLDESKQSAARHEKELGALEKTREQVELLRTQSTMAETALTGAQGQWRMRSERIDTADSASKRLARLEEEAAKTRPGLQSAESAAREANEEFARAEKASVDADARFDRAGLDFKFRHYELDLKKMRVRRDAVVADRKQRAESKRFLAETPLDAALHKKLQAAYLLCERVRAQAEVEGARMQIEALGDTTLELDGQSHTLASGETIERSVTDASELVLPGVARIQLRGGAGAAEAAEKLEETETSYRALLRDAGIAAIEDANEVLRKRAEAEIALEQCDRQIAQNLDDLTYEELAERVEGLENYVQNYLSEREADWPVPDDYDHAKRANSEAREARELCTKALHDTRARNDAAQTQYRELKDRVSESEVEIRVATRERDQAAKSVAAERDRKPDASVKSALEAATANFESARKAFADAEQTLVDQRPSAVREMAVNAQKVADRTARDLRATEDEARELIGRLDVRGSEGLFEREQESETHATRLARERDSLRARAGAAQRLFQSLSEQREIARRSYAAPFREKIEQLGRYVFNDSLQVELDENLAIVSRTLDNRTLTLDNLSGGAKEQLSLVARLAAALLVDEEDGVPVMLDDALGYSDPARLEGLGALLAHAGEHAQILILTCTPGRFRHVGDATVLRLT